jgi:AraC family transcriptional regulator
MADGAFGERLSEFSGVEAPPVISAGLLQTAEFTAARLQWERRAEPELFDIPSEEALLVFLLRKPYPSNPYRVDGRPVTLEPLDAGQFNFLDLRRSHVAWVQAASDCIALHLPIAAFHEVASETRLPRIGGLRTAPGLALKDPVVHHLSESLIPALTWPPAAQPLFVEHVGLALVTHVMERYGDISPDAPTPRGGLAPWQLREAKDLLMANLSGRLSLGDLAKACRLSRAHFARAFKATTGVAPYQWLALRRIELAKDLLAGSGKSLEQIAEECGFADASHLSRVFARRVGASPGRWRRLRQW